LSLALNKAAMLEGIFGKLPTAEIGNLKIEIRNLKSCGRRRFSAGAAKI